MYLQYPGGGGTVVLGRQFFSANCLASDEIKNVVYMSGDKVGGVLQVTTVDITNFPRKPAVGVIISKDSPTDCLVQTAGIIQNFDTGLTTDSRLFIGSDGKLTAIVPIRPLSGIKLSQVVARALSEEDILIKVEHPIILRGD